MCYNGVERASYTYSPNGNIFEVKDLDNSTTYQYYYDGQNVLQNVRAIKNGATYYNTYYGYDRLGRLAGKTISFEGVDSKTAGVYFVDYTYNADGLISSVTTNTNYTNNYVYDDIGRLESDNIVIGNTTVISNQYGYLTGISGYITNQIGSVATQIGGTQSSVAYTYDDRGNIISISKNGVVQISYQYDGLNQLVRENNLPLGKTYIYEYDGYGNLTSKKTYNYTTYGYGSIAGDEISTDTYTYNSHNQLISINGGTTIIYDEMGNPKEYNNGTNSFKFFWDEVSQISSMTKNGALIKFKYNQDGVRLEKTMGNYRTEYIVDGTTIIREKQYRKDTNQLTKDTYYYYDAKGMVTGANVSVYSGTDYATKTNYTFVFKTNIQGDVEAIYNTNGTLLVQYTYDAWGNFTSSLDSMQSIPSSEQLAAEGTGFRYRGYYYDTETGLYYLNARYYDSAIHRFVNRDDISYLGATGDFNSYNLYAYCSNNPVMFVDPSGNSLEGFLTQFIVSVASYVGMAIASIWDEEIRADMDAIGWNPFNENAEISSNANVVSFYKGVPVYKTNMERAGSFCAIFLNSYSAETTLKHEYGHSVQQMLIGPVCYGLMIGLPSWQEWSNRSYYDRPWEISADIFGGVSTRTHNQKDINRGYWYLASSSVFGVFSYFFLLGEY